MAYKPSPNSLIHCTECGEDYSATYKRCPFCGAKNAPPPAPAPRPSRDQEYEPEAQPEPDTRPGPSRPAAPADPDDTFVFDGQDLFDGGDEEDYAPIRPKGGKRLAEKSSPNPFADVDINWPRVITFVCSLIIIVAAMIIMFAVVRPQIWGSEDPTADGSQSPSPDVTGPGTDATQPGSTVTAPGTVTTDPVTEPSLDMPPSGSGELRGFTTNTYGKDEDGFTLSAGGSWQMELTFEPADWSGEVTYSVSDTRYATVSAGGKVVNVNPDSSLHMVSLTITAGGHTLVMPVYCRGVAATEPPVTQPPVTQPPASNPPVTQPPSGSGNVTVGRQGTIVNASGGLNVRSGPGTSYSRIASLVNGNTVTVLEDAGGGWYKISFAGEGGAATEGYIMGDYISTN